MEIKVNGRYRKFILGEGTKSTSGDKITKEDIAKYLIKEDDMGNPRYYVYFFESRVASTADAPNREEAINGIYDEFKKLGMGSLLLIDMEDEDGKKSKKETNK